MAWARTATSRSPTSHALHPYRRRQWRPSFQQEKASEPDIQLAAADRRRLSYAPAGRRWRIGVRRGPDSVGPGARLRFVDALGSRSEEHTSELQSLMRISYAVFCLKKKTNMKTPIQPDRHDQT